MIYTPELERDVKMQMELGYANFDVSLVRCLFAEIDRCHLLIETFKAQPVMSKSVLRRLESQIKEGA